MGFSAGGGPFSTGPKMNVTPLIDVLLVLLIVFMLVVIEQKPVGLKTEIPQQPNSNDRTIRPPQATIVIRVHHTKSGGKNVEMKDSQGELRQVEHPQVKRSTGIICATACATSSPSAQSA
jgi:biopolymer transport protein ExbD